MQDSPRKTSLQYEFGRFRLDTAQKSLLRDGQIVRLTPKLYRLLQVFVENSGRVLGKDELMNLVWPDAFIEEATLSRTVVRLKEKLGDEQIYIETRAGFGYCFTAHVKVCSTNAGEMQKEARPEAETYARSGISRRLASPFGGHLLHAVVACALYAGLFAVALLVEVAYEFDRCGNAAMLIAAAAFLWVLITSLAGLAVNWRLTHKASRRGLIVSALIFVAAVLALYISVTFFLPARPITKASFQTYTAQASYLRVICYCLALALFFIITPFNFVIAMQREMQTGDRRQVLKLIAGSRRGALPTATVYIKVQTLVVFLLVALGAVLFAMHLLFSNLSPSPFLNLFSNLLYARQILFFVLGLYCVVWYHKALNDLKRECIEDA